MKIKDVIIVGGGPAGISCAIQLSRYDIKPLILEKENLGGLLLNANRLENYPGFPEGIRGEELVALFKKQLKKQKIKVLFEEVVRLVANKEIFELTTNKSVYFSKYVVVASGTKPKEFKDCVVPGKLASKIFYDVYPLINLKNKKIAVVGAGDAAFDYALNLERHNDVIILNRGGASKCIPILFERVEKSSKINYKKNIKIKSISSSSGNTIRLECIASKGTWNIVVDYLLFAIGRVPCLDFLSSEVSKKILKNKNNGQLYLAGDVKNDIFRQTAIAAGEGIFTAMKIYRRIKKDTQ